MKTIKYITTIVILSLCSMSSLYAQESGNTRDRTKYTYNIPDKETSPIAKLDFDPAKFLSGTWIAYDGDMTYELTFRMDTVYTASIREAIWREAVAGTLVYKRNGTVVRVLSPPEDVHPKIYAYRGSERNLWGTFSDKENDIGGSLSFRLSETSDNRATWIVMVPDLTFEPIGRLDLPTEMTFYREGHTPEPIATRPGISTQIGM